MRGTKKVQKQKKQKEKPTGGAPLREMIIIDDASVVGAETSPVDPQLAGDVEVPSDSPLAFKEGSVQPTHKRKAETLSLIPFSAKRPHVHSDLDPGSKMVQFEFSTLGFGSMEVPRSSQMHAAFQVSFDLLDLDERCVKFLY